MNFLEKLNEINNHLEKVKQINHSIEAQQEISSLEKDLIKNHLRSLYDLYNDLSSLPKTTSADIVNAAIVENVVEKLAEAQIEETAAPLNHQGSNKSSEVEETPIQPEEIKVSKAKETVEPETKVEDLPVIAIEPSKPKEASVVSPPAAEKIEKLITKEVKSDVEQLELNQKVEKNDVSILEKYREADQQKEVVNAIVNSTKSVKQLITLNDKFILIKELFDSSVTRYDAAILAVDQSQTKSAALQYFEEQVWNTNELKEKEEVVDRVKEILDRKFGA